MPAPSTGTVTSHVTDSEGSTRLAQQQPAAWPSAKARHHAILHSAIESHGGHVFQVIGDAFCAALHTAPDALAAARAANYDYQAPMPIHSLFRVWPAAIGGSRMMP